MSDRNETSVPACEAARVWIHRVLDGDLMEAGHRQRLQDHIETCAACRELQAELRTIQEGLRAIPPAPLPAEVLEQVWQRTLRASGEQARPRGSWLDWRAAAAALVLAFTLAGLARLLPSTPERQPSVREVAEARYVLALTADALRKTGRVVVDEVLADEVSPALDRVPLKLPGGGDGDSRRDST